MTENRQLSCDFRVEMTVGIPDGRIYRYFSDRTGAKIGRIDRIELCDTTNDLELSILPSGSIDQICESYSVFGANFAQLRIPGYSLEFEDNCGDGTVTRVNGLLPDSFRSISGPLTMKKAFAQMCNEMGRNLSSLFEPTKGKLSASDIPEIVSSCGSKIKLIVNDRDFTKLELLHAILPPRPETGISLVQRYTKGEDILHVFTRGKGRILRTSGGRSRFESIPFEVSDEIPWEVIAVPPDEYYQVINNGSTNVEYFWAFVDHEDAFNTGGLVGLTWEENDSQGWGFQIDQPQVQN